MKNIIYLLIIGFLTSSCSNDEVTNSNEMINKFTLNNKEYLIQKAVSYIEGNNVDPDFYYFDIYFLTNNVEISASNDSGFSGTGSAFISSFINDTNTYLSNGEYTNADPANDFFDIWEAIGVANYDFDNDSGTDFYEFESALFNVARDENTYTITGFGNTPDDIPFTLYFKGTLEKGVC